MPVQVTLSKLLEERFMSRRELSRRTGIRQETINNLCNNKIRMIPVDAMDSICKELGVSPSDLFTDTGE